MRINPAPAVKNILPRCLNEFITLVKETPLRAISPLWNLQIHRAHSVPQLDALPAVYRGSADILYNRYGVNLAA